MMFWWVGLACGRVSTEQYQGLSETNQESLLLHQQAQVPGRMSVRLRLVNDNGVEQALAAHCLDDRILDSLQTITEDMTQLLCPVDHILIANDLESPDSHRTSQRITAIG